MAIERTGGRVLNSLSDIVFTKAEAKAKRDAETTAKGYGAENTFEIAGSENSAFKDGMEEIERIRGEEGSRIEDKRSRIEEHIAAVPELGRATKGVGAKAFVNNLLTWETMKYAPEVVLLAKDLQARHPRLQRMPIEDVARDLRSGELARQLQGSTPVNPAAVRTAASAADIARSVNTLGFKLQGALLGKGESGVLSGASVAMVLALMTNGTVGAEGDSLKRALGLEKLSPEEISLGFKSLTQALARGTAGATYQVANSVWADETFGLDPTFVKKTKKDFGADANVRVLARATDEINDWVSDATDGMIKDLVSPDIMADCYFAAVNAIFFKGTWTTAFDKSNTFDQSFTKADGATAELPMMFEEEGFGLVADGEDFRAVKLPFGKDKASSLAVIMPNEGKSTDDLVAKLATPAGQAEILGADFAEDHGSVLLPKLDLESKHDVLGAFDKLGIEGKGPFSAAGAHGTASFDVILQKARLTADEEGVKAAAATFAGGLESVRHTPVLLQANRPFVFAVIDEGTKAVVFSGTFQG